MVNLIWKCVPFSELTNEELYNIFQLRIAVFVVEQNCPYQDADYKDLQSYHLMGLAEGELHAYARLLPEGLSYPEVSIGRVITSPALRGKGAGIELMKKAIESCNSLFGRKNIRIGAQQYLTRFYESFGFIRTGNDYLEDGIPHTIMLLTQ